jgi:hypothetical protein
MEECSSHRFGELTNADRISDKSHIRTQHERANSKSRFASRRDLRYRCRRRSRCALHVDRGDQFGPTDSKLNRYFELFLAPPVALPLDGAFLLDGAVAGANGLAGGIPVPPLVCPIALDTARLQPSET